MSRKQWGHGYYRGFNEAFQLGYQKGKREPAVGVDILDEAYLKYKDRLKSKLYTIFDGCYVKNGTLYLLYPEDGRSVYVPSFLGLLDAIGVIHTKAEKRLLKEGNGPEEIHS